MSMINLLSETLQELEGNNLTENDVLYVTDGESYMSWLEFKLNANFNYYNGYGGEYINTNLKVVGENWWLERGNYDGSEWWDYKTLPTKPDNHNVFNLRE